MKLTRKEITLLISGSQDGGLRGNGNLDKVIKDAIRRAEDLDDIKRDLEYAVHQLTEALNVLKTAIAS